MDALLTAEQVAERLAVPERWVRDHTRAGTIPHLKLGRYARYHWPDVVDWLRSCEQGGRPTSSGQRGRAG
jgi:excisionase family DNA binding protein